MMGSASRRALYTGVTVPFYKRVWEHKNDQGGYFTSKYKCYRLLYYEQFTNVEAAIAREKEIKSWRREKKDRLVESMNPEWKDPENKLHQHGLITEFSRRDRVALWSSTAQNSGRAQPPSPLSKWHFIENKEDRYRLLLLFH